MTKPVLVVMAAGMGSRYGGLKQIDPWEATPADHRLFHLRRPARRFQAGGLRHQARTRGSLPIRHRSASVPVIDVQYAYQELSDLPEGYAVPAGRVKPWGTCHAVLAARSWWTAPCRHQFRRYYGRRRFRTIYDYLPPTDRPGCYEYAMVGYLLGNTVTEHGHVARGVCREDARHYLEQVVEHTHIEPEGADARFTEDGGQTWTRLSGGTIVSMNLWGFTNSFLSEAQRRFPAFLDRALAEDPLKSEYFLPSVVSQLIDAGKAGSRYCAAPRNGTASRIGRTNRRWWPPSRKKPLPGSIPTTCGQPSEPPIDGKQAPRSLPRQNGEPLFPLFGPGRPAISFPALQVSLLIRPQHHRLELTALEGRLDGGVHREKSAAREVGFPTGSSCRKGTK